MVKQLSLDQNKFTGMSVIDDPRRDYLMSHISQWISVKESLPEQETPVLGITSGKTIVTITYTKTEIGSFQFRTIFDYCRVPNITHWMPLPKPPEEI